MPAKKTPTDWKRLAQEETSGGRELLAKGTRSSEGNDGKFVPARSRKDMLAALEANRKLRAATVKRKKSKEKVSLKGLFGGGS